MGKLKGQGYLYGKPESADEVRQRLSLAGKLAKVREPTQQAEQPMSEPLPKIVNE